MHFDDVFGYAAGLHDVLDINYWVPNEPSYRLLRVSDCCFTSLNVKTGWWCFMHWMHIFENPKNHKSCDEKSQSQHWSPGHCRMQWKPECAMWFHTMWWAQKRSPTQYLGPSGLHGPHVGEPSLGMFQALSTHRITLPVLTSCFYWLLRILLDHKTTAKAMAPMWSEGILIHMFCQRLHGKSQSWQYTK